MTSTAARPEGSLPVEQTAIVKAEGTEALKDVAYGSALTMSSLKNHPTARFLSVN
ncbi:MAG: hypothetical protein Q9191_008410 [Dirinaria sp. TL-2023a]